MPDLPKRKPTRLKNYNYSSAGAYFITICTEGRKKILSEICVGTDVPDGPQINLTDYGKIAESGTHDQLLTYGGIYASLYETQAQYYA